MIRVSIEVVAETREDAIRLIRDCAKVVKQGGSGVERQHCMGALRVSVIDDDHDEQMTAFEEDEDVGLEGTDRVEALEDSVWARGTLLRDIRKRGLTPALANEIDILLGPAKSR